MVTAVQEFSQFFNRLVELIPAKYYSNDEDVVNLQFMKKADRLAAKKEFKEKRKQNKLAKLSTVEANSVEDKPAETEIPSTSGSLRPDAKQVAPLLNIPTENTTRDELHEKLQLRLQALRQQRQQNEKKEAAKKAKDWKQKTLEQNAKQKQQQSQQQKNNRLGLNGGQKQQKQQKAQASSPAGVKRKPESEGADVGVANKRTATLGQASRQQSDSENANGGSGAGGSGFAYPRIELDNGKLGKAGTFKGGKKLTKEQLLKQAEAKQKEKALSDSGDEAKVKASGEAWKAALLRAGGEKVLDDPKLLRRSLKKDAKRREKSARAWQERNAVQNEQSQKKQTKRKENLQARAQGRVDKKKVKREKKLLRAGFEGRRTGFIGDNKAAGNNKAGGGKQ
ncbi:hypothetical protein CEUSTIGMA_g12920.t1 [Chlamydomonas eustigma]|uniref:Ribosomal RNA-processing protein 14/surfeit locus protein 6 C-terminal domain-containing protein n=1 Tax=Chlamydomonas eustigma TaxID=1157962 RepID=A0A250XR22_9CHLO|nr:hypothetical protein CEUSTIGMA_g12920.t1 [Chlamydomonas eustigma]|eukprot:GAX85504.1 hypothetical protein CEUSTIGMA_g12920.t1 [Chlamydomonas eustigma]